MPYLRNQIFGKQRFREIASVLVLLVLVCTLGIYIVESQNPEGNIKTLFDAFWWAIVTTVTVGYGDFVPVTILGKIIGLVLIIFGATLYSTIFVIIGTVLGESHEQYHWHRADERLEKIEKQLEAIKKAQDFLVSKHAKGQES